MEGNVFLCHSTDRAVLRYVPWQSSMQTISEAGEDATSQAVPTQPAVTPGEGAVTLHRMTLLLSFAWHQTRQHIQIWVACTHKELM